MYRNADARQQVFAGWRHKKLADPLNILISHACSERLSDVCDALAAGDRQAMRRVIEGAYLEIRDDLGQHAAPEWLDHVQSPSALVHAVCTRISDGMRQLANGVDETVGIVRDATTRAVACICLAMDEAEEAQLASTLSEMKRHAAAVRDLAVRLGECPPLRDLSPALRRAVETCVSSRIGECASALTGHEGAENVVLASAILATCTASLVGQRDLVPLGLDGRRDRRGVDLAAGLVHLCLESSAHALGAPIPDGLRALSVRMATGVLNADPSMEPRLRARMLAVGRI